MDNMELTNLNSSLDIEAEVEVLQQELMRHKISEKNVLEELEREKSEALLYKNRYEECICRISKMEEESNAAQSTMESDIMTEILIEAEKLKSSIALLEDELKLLKTNDNIDIGVLRATLADLERSQTPPAEESTIDQELIDLMEYNAKLKEDNALLVETLNEKVTEELEIKEKVCNLETEFNETQRHLKTKQQSLKEMKENVEAKQEEKATLLMQLNQMNCQPLTELNKKGSLFDEVTDQTTDLATKYNLYKKKYVKAKEILSQNNAEIIRLKADSLKYKNVVTDKKNKKLKLMEELRSCEEKRIQDLTNAIELMETKMKNSEQVVPVVINRKNISDIDYYAKAAQREVVKAKQEIESILSFKLPLEKQLFQCERELIGVSKELKDIVELNIQLEEQIKPYEIKKEATEIPASASETTKKIRFAVDVKYIEEN